MSTPPFNIDVGTRDGATVLSVEGELDIATAPLLRRELSRVLAEEPRRVTVDLCDLTFLDVRGLHGLLTAAQTATDHGTELVLERVPERVHRLAEITGTGVLLPFERGGGESTDAEDGRPGNASTSGDLATDERAQRRVARNEAWMRRLNEAIERGLWPGEQLVAFRCECAHPTCNERLELSVSEYERLRAHPRRFVVLAGHELPEIETVVEAHAGYLTVEKCDLAGATAEALDPRR